MTLMQIVYGRVEGAAFLSCPLTFVSPQRQAFRSTTYGGVGVCEQRTCAFSANVAPFGIKEGLDSQGHVYNPFLTSLLPFLLFLSLSFWNYM